MLRKVVPVLASLSGTLFGEVEEVWKKLESTYYEDFSALVYGVLPDAKEIKSALKLITIRLKEYDKS